MIRPSRARFLRLTALALVACGLSLCSVPDRAWGAGDHGVACSIEVVVETRNSTGLLVATETYVRDFALAEGGSYSDDFSTRTRFKFFDARFDKLNGESVISADWFADVTVFNSVNLSTSVSLERGNKRGKSSASHTLYTSSGSTTTRFTLTAIED